MADNKLPNLDGPEIARGFVALLNFLRENHETPADAVITCLVMARYLCELKGPDPDELFDQMVAKCKTVEMLQIPKKDLIGALTLALSRGGGGPAS